jgi:hypothetical protein
MELVTVRSKHLQNLVDFCLKNNNGAFYVQYLEPVINDMQKDKVNRELKDHIDNEMDKAKTPIIEG